MKTQIITLAEHDDLVSVRDRMSWAKSPRILLVWPAHAQVPLQPLDLRILQQHASRLGAQLGVITRRGEIRRDASSFGIAVFHTLAEAQRGAWPRGRKAGRRWLAAKRHSSIELRNMSDSLRARGHPLTQRPAPRIAIFSLGVLAVLAVTLLFVPRAEIRLMPIKEEQSAVITIDVAEADGSAVLGGSVPSRRRTVTVSGTGTMTVNTRAELPVAKATGRVEFRNLTAAPLVIPQGTIVYSVSPRLVRFATMDEVTLEEGTNASAEAAIEALDPGEPGNVPAAAIRGVEGRLGTVIQVSNIEPTTGGTNELRNLPSQADRDELRAGLLEDLLTRAKAQLSQETEAGDVVLPGGMQLVSVEEERFDPAPGEPASVLNMEMTAAFSAAYVQGADLRRLASVALDGSLSPGFDARPASLQFAVDPEVSDNPGQPAGFALRTSRIAVRHIDAQQVNLMVRGQTPARAATALESMLPLEGPAAIKLTPSWWPWLPLIPFRIDVVII